jgi:glycopeptide antibiotics resistance protein
MAISILSALILNGVGMLVLLLVLTIIMSRNGKKKVKPIVKKDFHEIKKQIDGE